MLKQTIKGRLYQSGHTLSSLAYEMNISPSNLSMLLNSNMTMSSALKLNDALFALTQTQLTLDDFRKDQ